VTGWDASNAYGVSWEVANDPCPSGWLVPTANELDKLLDTDNVTSVWTLQNGVYGRRFIDNSSGLSIFLPATGNRSYDDGSLNVAGRYGYCWSSSPYYSAFAWHLIFSRDDLDQIDHFRSSGLPVRCVRVDNLPIEVAVTDVMLNETKATLVVEDTLRLFAAILPRYASNREVTWSSSNNTVATVSADGLITAVNSGIVVITVTTKDGNYKDDCIVMVRGFEDLGILINGVVWAESNVDASGTFAANPEDYGMFYQWNRKKGWPATGMVFGWDSSSESGDSWAAANDPCPSGWRVPTSVEMEKLLDTNKVASDFWSWNLVLGMKFTDNFSGRYIFLPAVGAREYMDGFLFGQEYGGYYWTSSAYSYDTAHGGYGMRFYVSDVFPLEGNSYAYGYSVRCVYAE
jgi:uncharacterized protein (TIGR02145 family)